MKVTQKVNHPKATRAYGDSLKITRAHGLRFPQFEEGFQFVSGDEIEFISGDDFKLISEG